MLTDAGAIGLALVAVRLAQRPARGAYTFGLGRAEILSAQVNGVSLLVLAGLIAVPAVQRIADPPQIDGGVVLVIGLAGAAVNGAAAWALSRATRDSLNVRGAFLHNLADMASSIAAALAGLAVLAFGWDAADGIAALAVAALMLWGGWGLVRDASRGAARGRAARRRSRADRPRDGRRPGDRRGPRPPRLGGHLGFHGARRARARRARRRLPRPPPRADAAAARALRASSTPRCRSITRAARRANCSRSSAAVRGARSAAPLRRGGASPRSSTQPVK